MGYEPNSLNSLLWQRIKNIANIYLNSFYEKSQKHLIYWSNLFFIANLNYTDRSTPFTILQKVYRYINWLKCSCLYLIYYGDLCGIFFSFFYVYKLQKTNDSNQKKRILLFDSTNNGRNLHNVVFRQLFQNFENFFFRSHHSFNLCIVTKIWIYPLSFMVLKSDKKFRKIILLFTLNYS